VNKSIIRHTSNIFNILEEASYMCAGDTLVSVVIGIRAVT